MPAFAPLQSQVDNNTCAALLRYRAPLALRPIICQENCSFHLMQLQPSLWHPSTAVSSTTAASIAAASGTIPDSICCSPRFIASIYISLKAMLQCPSTAASSIIAAPINFSLKASLQLPSAAVSRQHYSFFYFSLRAILQRPSVAASSIHLLQSQGIILLLQCQGNIAPSFYCSLKASLEHPSTSASRHPHDSLHHLFSLKAILQRQSTSASGSRLLLLLLSLSFFDLNSLVHLIA